MTITEKNTTKGRKLRAYLPREWPALRAAGRASLTSPYRDVSALGLHHDGGHGHGNGDGIEVGGVWCQGEDGCLGGQGLPPLHNHLVEAADEPHGPHDGLE